MAAPASTDEPKAVDNVAVSFFTESPTPAQKMPGTTFSVPLNTLPEGLGALVNSVLSIDPPMAFDFLVEDDYVATSLERFMRRKGKNAEEVLMVEYKPALQAQEGSKLPHDDWVSSVQCPLVGNAEFVVTAAYDHCVRVWAGDECLSIGAAHTEAVKAVAVNQTTVVPVGVATDGKKASKKRREREIDTASLEFASVSKDGTLKAWAYDGDSKKVTLRGSVAQHADSVDCVDIAPTGDLVATGSWDRTVKVFQWRSLVAAGGPATGTTHGPAPLYSLADHARAVLAVRFSPTNSTLLYSAGQDSNVKAWDLAVGRLVGTFAGDHAIQAVAARPAESGSSDLILTGHTDNRVRLFDPRHKKPVVKAWAGHRQWVYSVAWGWRPDEENAPAISGGATIFASAGEDAAVKIWDLRSMTAPLLTLDRLHNDGVLGVAYAGGRQFATCAKDNRTKSVSLDDSGNQMM